MRMGNSHVGKSLVCGFVVLCAICCLSAPRTVVPRDNLGSRDWKKELWWKNRHDAILKRIAESKGEFDLVLLGDSISQNWDSAGGDRGRAPLGKMVAARRFRGVRYLNLGFGGDYTENVIWRCQNGELDGYTTPLFTLLIGTNNRFDKPCDIAAGVKRIIELVREKHPESRILLTPILPRNPLANDPKDLPSVQAEANRLIRPFADGETVIWNDWSSKLLGADGKLDPSLMFDEVHPNDRGYEIWADTIAPFMNGLMRSRTATVGEGRFAFNERTGSLVALAGRDGRPAADLFALRYTVQAKSGDIEASEEEDSAVSCEKGNGVVTYVCTNPKLPGITITKSYRRVNGGVRRDLTFLNASDESRYITPFEECHFNPVFQENLFHLGAGYIGPYKPFPKVAKARPVNEYRQSSKGLALINPDGKRGNFSHFRVKIDNTVVLPWFHSTIGHYREYHDRLWYLPDGYKMGLGTFGLYKGKPVTVADQFNFFDGDIFTFFDEVFAKDPDVAAELASIPAPPKSVDDVLTHLGPHNLDYIRFYTEAIDEGDLLVLNGCWPGLQFCWGDYRVSHDFQTSYGGRATPEELREALNAMRAFSPRVKASAYNMILSTSYFAPIVKEHPEWYRDKDRDGNRDSNFPGLQLNWQTMFDLPETREWVANMEADFSEQMPTDFYYIDEFQMSNTIDWQRDRVTRDDDAVKCWKLFAARKAKSGKIFFANGSGNPYADLNFMESPHELAPHRWRDWCGVGFGINLMSHLRPGQRTALLYWYGGNDYANRVLALGWVPVDHFNVFNSIPVVRACFQNGAMIPINAKYSPDWKNDPKTEIESHAVRRHDAKDVLLSFISRPKSSTDVPVRIDFGSLGFEPGERVNIWRQHVDYLLPGTNSEEILSDREIKGLWKRGILDQTRITDPELLSSRVAGGEFSYTFKGLAQDQMDQFLVTAAPASFFALNGMPLSYFLTSNRHGCIRGRRVKVDCEAEILLADGDRDFFNVTLNGKPAQTRRIRLNGGLVGALVKVAAGEWTLGWKTRPRGNGAGEGVELPVAPSVRQKTSVKAPSFRYEPERNEVQDANVVKDGVRIAKTGVYVSRTNISSGLQTNLPVSVASADARTLTLQAGISRRESEVQYVQSFGGFELVGARQIRCRLSHTFADAIAIRPGHVAFKSGQPGERFTGLVIDYRVGGKYVKRVSFATGLFRADYMIRNPNWGTARQPDERFDLGDWIEEPSGRVFSLDISKYAPKGWDGTAFVSLGASRVNCGRSLKLEFLSFNDAAAKDFVTPQSGEAAEMPAPIRSKPLKQKPNSLKKVDATEWRNWTKIDRFIGLGGIRLKAQTRAYVAHDYEHIYIGVEADEPNEKVSASAAEAWANDHVEVLVDRPDGVIYQVAADVKERMLFFLNRASSEATKGIVTHSEVVPGKCWRIFVALPVDALKFDMQHTPVNMKLEIARSRCNPAENSAWTPLERMFHEREKFGTVILDFE